MVGTFLSVLFFVHMSHAVDFKDIKSGDVLELTENVQANKIKSGAVLLCRVGEHGVYPRVAVGPETGADVPIKYFTVVAVVTDPTGYEVKLHSEQMPCACILSLTQWISFFGGNGSNFKTLKFADPQVLDTLPPSPSSCRNDPDWMNKLNSFDDEAVEI